MPKSHIKISIVTEFISVTQNSTGYFWSKIIEKLEKEKVISQIISPNIEGNAENTDDLLLYKTFIKPNYNKNRLLSRLVGQIILTMKFAFFSYKYICKNHLVLSGTNPAILLCIFPILKLLIGFPWILIVHDIYPDNLVPAGILNHNSLLFRAASYYFKWVYSVPDHLIVIGRDMEKILRYKISNQNKISYIPNWVGSCDIFPLKKEEVDIIRHYNLSDKIVFQFFGNMGRVQGINELLAIINKVKNPKAAFLFIGDGSEKLSVIKFIEKNMNKNVFYHGHLDYFLRNEGLAACDIAIVTLKQEMLGLGVPSKAYFSMAADRPLFAIVDEQSEISMMIKEHNIGWVVSPGDVHGAAKIIDEICEKIFKLNKASPRTIYEKYYNDEFLLELLYREIKKYIH